MKQIPYFSAIMPVKDRADVIQSSIDSIIYQIYKNWELIIVDDHSRDNLIGVLKQYSDKRIKYLPLINKTGPGAARNFGIKHSLGKYIVITDSDDLSKKNRLQLTSDFLSSHPEAEIVYGDIERHQYGHSKKERSCRFNRDLLTKYNFIYNTAACFSKESFQKCSGYDETLMTGEDYDLWLSLSEKKANFFYLNKILATYTVHQESLTQETKYDQRKKNLEYIRKKHHLETPNINNFKKIAPNHIWKKVNQKKGLEFWFS